MIQLEFHFERQNHRLSMTRIQTYTRHRLICVIRTQHNYTILKKEAKI